ncbi:hypothetical protein LIER_40798 [Lithospermum erythrorhizon]|uniref:Reverse transcriptase zinc-binding domain-containing protein n=1 Tax=Lithospermum erythrorhizon TaxID=34254 RepID=A0AAV3R001_LITER
MDYFSELLKSKINNENFDYHPGCRKIEVLNIKINMGVWWWWKMIWFNENVSKYNFIMWILLLGRLPTKDRLRK